MVYILLFIHVLECCSNFKNIHDRVTYIRKSAALGFNCIYDLTLEEYERATINNMAELNLNRLRNI